MKYLKGPNCGTFNVFIYDLNCPECDYDIAKHMLSIGERPGSVITTPFLDSDEENALRRSEERSLIIKKQNVQDAIERLRKARENKETVQAFFADTLTAFRIEPVRAEMLKASYGKVMHSFTVLLSADDRDEDALKYANYAYPYVDREKKQAIRNHF